MSRALLVVALCISFISGVAAQSVPKNLRGKWRVRRILPADTISCWGDREVKRLLGTEIEYTADSFRWKDHLVTHPIVKVTVVKAEQFQKEYSGSGSFVDFGLLGIRASQATRVQIDHAPADITGGTVEIPGDDVFIENRNTIVFSVCNVYFEAKREGPQKSRSK